MKLYELCRFLQKQSCINKIKWHIFKIQPREIFTFWQLLAKNRKKVVFFMIWDKIL